MKGGGKEADVAAVLSRGRMASFWEETAGDADTSGMGTSRSLAIDSGIEGVEVDAWAVDDDDVDASPADVEASGIATSAAAPPLSSFSS